MPHQGVSFGSSEWARIHTGQNHRKKRLKRHEKPQSLILSVNHRNRTDSQEPEQVRQYKFTSGRKVDLISRESGRISVSEAAKLLGVSQQFVRIGMQQGRLPIGTAVKMSSRWTYYICEEKLEDYMKKPPVTATTDGKGKMC